MKKSIIILISAIYIMSILFIGFFGMRMTSYNETVYPTSIEIESVEGAEYRVQSNGMQVIIYTFKENVPAQQNVFSIIYHVYPDTATDRTISYSYDQNNAPISEIDERNNVWVTRRGGVTITITANARPTIQTTFYLLVV